jgi:hypothetical protein
MLALLACVGACGGAGLGDQPAEQEEPGTVAKTIEEAQAQLTDSVMSLPGVVGIAIGECEGEPCIKVLVVEETAELAEKIPSRFEGYPVALLETGEIRARPRDH